MNLLVMRHGDAEPYKGASTDAARALTGFGREQAKSASKKLLERRRPDTVFISPYRRAQETAAIVLMELESGAASKRIKPVDSDVDSPARPIRSETMDWLTPEADLAQVTQGLSEVDAPILLLVSHMPLVSVLTSYLCGENHAFGTAQIACIELEFFHQGQGELKWLL